MCSQHGNNQSQQPDLNPQQDSWKTLISDIEQDHKELFQWLVVQFDITGHETWFRKKQLLEEAITNPEKLKSLLLKLQQDQFDLQKNIEQLQQCLKQSLEQLKKDKDPLFNWLLDLFDINDYSWKQTETLANKMKDDQILFAVFKKIQESDISLKTEIDHRQKTDDQLFKWLLQCFGIHSLYSQAENLEKRMRDHKVLFDVFAQLRKYSGANYQQQQNCRQEIYYLAKQNRIMFGNLLFFFGISKEYNIDFQKQQLETKLIDPISSLQAFKKFQESYNEIHRKLEQAQNSENAMKQELEKLRQERRSVSYYEERIEELEAENEALKKRSGEMFATLSKQNRNETTTITSDDSRLQRDTLISQFKTLASQDFKQITVQIFNYLTSSNSELQNNRKQQEAKIRAILSQRIFESEISWITQNNGVSSESNLWTMKAKEIAQLITQDLFQQSTGNIPNEIIENLENLTQKGLKLVKDIINDQPPGELWIEPEGKNFNSGKHEPFIGCQPKGIILYTTYPGYRAGSRILEKAIVFTVPKPEINPSTEDVTITSNTSETTTKSSDIPLSSELTASEKVKALNDKGMTDDDIAEKLGVTLITVSNWKKGFSNPSKENAEKLDRLYQDVCCKSSNLENDLSAKEDQKTFSGVVKNQWGIFLFKNPKYNDQDYSQKREQNDQINFDSIIEGDNIYDSEANIQDNIWLRVAGTDYWIPRAYIRLDQELS